MEEGKFGRAARKRIFTVKVVKHSHRLPRVVDVTLLEMFKARLDHRIHYHPPKWFLNAYIDHDS